MRVAGTDGCMGGGEAMSDKGLTPYHLFEFRVNLFLGILSLVMVLYLICTGQTAFKNGQALAILFWICGILLSVGTLCVLYDGNGIIWRETE
jgi:hypothetical protein